ncbi:Uncharacterised protein g1015 [Pycnogonum litorale]
MALLSDYKASSDSRHFGRDIADETSPINSSSKQQTEEGSTQRSCSSTQHVGLSWWTAALYLAGEMVGSGLLVLPKIIDLSGWIGVVVFVVFISAVGYMTILLGRCRLLLIERWPSFQMNVRDSYSSIGYRAFGYPGKLIVAACLKANLFGGSVTLVLLGSQLAQSVMNFTCNLSFCHWVLVYGVVLIPLMWFATPKDIWIVGVAAFGSTLLVAILILVAVVKESVDSNEERRIRNTPTFESFCKAFAMMTFIFGGISIFPSVHSDMKKKEDYSAAIIFMFICMLLLYLPIGLTSYVKFGSSVQVNVLMSLSPSYIRMLIEILMIGHFFLAFLIAINPVCLEFEQLLKIPHHFSWQRCTLRTSVMMCILAVCFIVPSFNKVMALIGAGFGTITTFMCPIILYVRLSSMFKDDNRYWIRLHEKVILVEIFSVAVVACISATYFALTDIMDPETSTPPCFT